MNSQSIVTASRGSGSYVGNLASFDRRGTDEASWEFTARAVGAVKARFVSLGKFHELSAKRPEIEADGRAGKSETQQASGLVFAEAYRREIRWMAKILMVM